MARMHRHFAEEEAENDLDYSKDSRAHAVKEWRELKMEFRELKEELKSALREKMDSTSEEKKRILGILKKNHLRN